MNKTYSIQIGIQKGLLSLLAIFGALAMFTGFTDVSIWELIETNLKPVLSSLTVGGLITVAVNYVKFKMYA